MKTPDEQSLDDTYRAVWDAFVAGGKVQPAFTTRPADHGLHLVFLCPVGESPEVGAKVAPSQERLAFPFADLVPAELLHVSIQGFDVAPAEWLERKEEVFAAARAVFATVSPFTVRLGWLNSFPMAAFLRAEDGGMIRRLRSALREALPSWTGVDRDPMVRDGRDEWLPHMSIAYYNAELDNREVVEAISALGDGALIEVEVREVHLISTPADLTGAERWVWPVHQVFGLGLLNQE